MKNIEDYELSNSAAGYDYSAIVRDYMKEHPEESSKKAVKALMRLSGGKLNFGELMRAMNSLSA